MSRIISVLCLFGDVCCRKLLIKNYIMRATATQPSKNSRMSIEVFDASLLKETNLMCNDDYIGDNETDFDEETVSGIEEMNFGDFEKTLFE